MVFPGLDVPSVSAIIEGFHGAPRWRDVTISARILSRAGDGVVIWATQRKVGARMRTPTAVSARRHIERMGRVGSWFNTNKPLRTRRRTSSKRTREMGCSRTNGCYTRVGARGPYRTRRVTLISVASAALPDREGGKTRSRSVAAWRPSSRQRQRGYSAKQTL